MATTPSEWVVGTQEKVCFVSQAGTPALVVHIEVVKSILEKVLMSRLNLDSGRQLWIYIIF